MAQQDTQDCIEGDDDAFSNEVRHLFSIIDIFDIPHSDSVEEDASLYVTSCASSVVGRVTEDTAYDKEGKSRDCSAGFLVLFLPLIISLIQPLRPCPQQPRKT